MRKQNQRKTKTNKRRAIDFEQYRYVTWIIQWTWIKKNMIQKTNLNFLTVQKHETSPIKSNLINTYLLFSK
jgi:hypothetical protein